MCCELNSSWREKKKFFFIYFIKIKTSQEKVKREKEIFRLGKKLYDLQNSFAEKWEFSNGLNSEFN